MQPAVKVLSKVCEIRFRSAEMAFAVHVGIYVSLWPQ